MNIPKTNKKRIVVVGGGFGGIQMIAKLKNTPYQLVLLDKQNSLNLQPLLYQAAPVAIQHGQYLAKNLKRMLRNEKTHRFKYMDKGSMTTVEKNKAKIDFFKLKFGGFLSWRVWMFVHIMSLVGFRNLVITLMNWS